MSNDRSGRTLLAATLLLAAVLIAMNRAVVSAPLVEWWLPALLAIVGIGVIIYRPRAQADETPVEAPRRVREYLPAATPLIASPEKTSVPQNTDAAMVMSPANPVPAGETSGDTAVDESGGVVAAAEPAPASTQASSPAPTSTDTDAAVANVMPAHTDATPEFVQPVAPGTPEPTPAEPPIVSESTSQPTEAGPVNPTANQVPIPADDPSSKNEPSHMARTEFAEAERIAEKDAPPPPPAKEGEPEDAPRPAPETQVVMESTADAPQPYETAQTGEVTPETIEDVAEGRGEETQVAENLTETASPQMSQQETDGESVAGTGDDLTRIDGIGQKTAAALRAAGIDSFQKLANTSETQLNDILRTAKVRSIAGASSWSQQAAYAAQGDWDGFNRFIRERKARSED